ncbi:MAG: dephospho-CoA kinase [Bacteroidetes bacterium]|nr:dephospho-CoA kinase [Bacteroidota bacterium]
MLKVGLTGGMGSGKSTVAQIFEVMGVPVYYADAEAKKIMSSHPKLIQEIKKLFGQDAYTNGQLNRSLIAEKVFKQKDLLNQLNALVHPYTIAHAKEWMNQQTAPYAIKEAALIFESGIQGEFDVIIGVSAPHALRVQRTMKRDGIGYDQVMDRLQHQIDEEIKLRLCDEIIINDEQKMLVPQVLALHEKFSTFSK